jgi:MoxR-like ATPase
MKVSQALALLEGQEFVTPELIQRVAVEVIAHRLVLEPEAKFAGADARRIVRDVLAEVPAPV